MSSVSLLPPELCDHILDCLHDDRPTLRRCALASREWLPRAQHHLFRSLYVDWANCSSLSQLIDRNPTLAYHVAALEIEGTLGIFSGDRAHGAALDAWLKAMPESYSRLFSNLTKLELALVSIDAETVRIFRRFPAITHLALWACPLVNFDVFVELFASYPHLTRLNISFSQDWEVSLRPITRMTSNGTLPRLESLELTSDDSINVLRWLIAQDLHRTLHTLSCARISWSSLAVLADALSALAPSLKALSVDFGDQYGGTESTLLGPSARWRRQPVFLTPLASLTHLTLDVHTGRLAAVPCTLFLLLHLPAPALRQITFAVKSGEYDTTFPVPWQRIAEATARVARGSPVQRVVVSVREKDDGPFATPGEGGGGVPPFSSPSNGGLASADLAQMERAVVSAFMAHGLEKLVRFVRRRGA